MATTPTIRPYSAADFEDVVALWRRSMDGVARLVPQIVPHTPDEDRAYFASAIVGRCALTVCEDAGRVVGFLAMDGACVDRLYVDPPAQRRGVGKLLMAEACRASPTGLWLFTHQANAPARGFYEKLGFRAMAFGVSPPPECAPDVRYAWDGERPT
jgi:ribosomal protein S18 acetylase RimI-like enzyme